MIMDVEMIDLHGEHHEFTGVDHISYVNNESFGPGEKIGLERLASGDTLLVVNVNGFAALGIKT